MGWGIVEAVGPLFSVTVASTVSAAFLKLLKRRKRASGVYGR